MAEISSTEWDSFLAQHPDHHILQTSPWGQLKTEFGWQVTRIAVKNCGAQILVRQVFPGIRFAYLPKGPVGADWDGLWPEIDAFCRRQHYVFMKIEPDLWESENEQNGNRTVEIPENFIVSRHSIQPMRTLLVDISGDEVQILGRMKQKTRYNINLALKKNVVVKPHTDMSTFYHLMEITGQRDQFSIHNQAYYQHAYDLFNRLDHCQLFVAELEDTPLAALIVFSYGKRAWYFYGASSNIHKELMPNYLLQWEAIRWAKSQNCTLYDLWGVPDADIATLEANFSTHNEGLWGVYRFKRGFGGELMRASGPWDRVYNPALYALYRWRFRNKAPE